MGDIGKYLVLRCATLVVDQSPSRADGDLLDGTDLGDKIFDTSVFAILSLNTSGSFVASESSAAYYFCIVQHFCF